MKRTALPLLAAAFVAFAFIAGCGNNSGLKDTPPEVKLYGVESARVEYAYSGDAKGTKKIAIANFGMYESDNDDFTLSMNGQSNVVKTLSIRCDTMNYTIDLSKNTGMSAAFSLQELKTATEKYTAEQKENVNAELIQQMMGGKKVGKETILGKECDIFELPGGGKISLWKGIVLKQDMPMGGMKFGLVATKIEEDVDFTIADFTPPKDVKIEAPGASNPGMPPGHPPVDGGQGQ